MKQKIFYFVYKIYLRYNKSTRGLGYRYWFCGTNSNKNNPAPTLLNKSLISPFTEQYSLNNQLIINQNNQDLYTTWLQPCFLAVD